MIIFKPEDIIKMLYEVVGRESMHDKTDNEPQAVEEAHGG